jgi:hypothetical protein
MSLIGALMYAGAFICGILAIPLKRIVLWLGVIVLCGTAIRASLYLLNEGLKMPIANEFAGAMLELSIGTAMLFLWFFVVYGVSYFIGYAGRRLGLLTSINPTETNHREAL